MSPSSRLIKLCLVASFASLAAMCVACFALRPELFEHPHWGLSYYATLWPTAVPYTLGLAGGAGCLVAIAHMLRLYGKQMQTIRLFFTLIGNLLLGVLLTPISVSSILFWMHMTIGLVMLVVQMSLLAWVVRQPDIHTVDRVLVGVSFVAGVHLVLSNEAIALLDWYMLGEIVALGAGLAVLGRLMLRRLAPLPETSAQEHAAA